MAGVPSLRWSEIVKGFAKAGWQHDRTRGSHYVMTRPGQPGLLSIPMHDPVKRGTLRRLIRDAGMTVDEFQSLV